MQQRRCRRKLEPVRGCHCVQGDFGSGGLQRPSRMVDFAAIDFFPGRSVETVTLGEEIFERAWLRLEDLASSART